MTGLEPIATARQLVREPYCGWMSKLNLNYDPCAIDAAALCRVIQAEYWGKGLSESQILKSIQHSYCVSGWIEKNQIGFARAVSDRSTCAHIKDFVVFPGYRKCGFGKRLMTGLLAHPSLSEVESWYLGTRNAHSFYARFGFKASSNGIHMYLHISESG
ncbi:GNAT family N-acetyltransferase [Roseibium sp. RKSG952]|uniref:GNAT family N-acetyltransferase n=1 Tax=Roseibium sp. RKSG952 TaxID=2529384 RepID=UPI0012BBA805|nr:N-acetyltransferase [Roseibium sp. RKSG952]